MFTGWLAETIKRETGWMSANRVVIIDYGDELSLLGHESNVIMHIKMINEKTRWKSKLIDDDNSRCLGSSRLVSYRVTNVCVNFKKPRRRGCVDWDQIGRVLVWQKVEVPIRHLTKGWCRDDRVARSLRRLECWCMFGWRVILVWWKDQQEAQWTLVM